MPNMEKARYLYCEFYTLPRRGLDRQSVTEDGFLYQSTSWYFQ